MKKVVIAAAAALLGVTAVAVAVAAPMFHEVHPGEYDPGKTNLVQAAWVNGIGCPTNAKTYDGTTTASFTAGGCPTGDAKDTRNEGLLLAKTGPTGNVAAAQADIKDVKNVTLTELGYDLRKPVGANDPRGSHCGAGAPRFDVNTTDGTFFVGCNSPAATQTAVGDGWIRLRWAGPLLAYGPSGLGPITGTVQSVQLVFDEGQDTGPDNFGAAVVDNVDVNGTLVGQGPNDPN